VPLGRDESKNCIDGLDAGGKIGAVELAKQN
jgi:hypothetical protein